MSEPSIEQSLAYVQKCQRAFWSSLTELERITGLNFSPDEDYHAVSVEDIARWMKWSASK